MIRFILLTTLMLALLATGLTALIAPPDTTGLPPVSWSTKDRETILLGTTSTAGTITVSNSGPSEVMVRFGPKASILHVVSPGYTLSVTKPAGTPVFVMDLWDRPHYGAKGSAFLP